LKTLIVTVLTSLLSANLALAAKAQKATAAKVGNAKVGSRPHVQSNSRLTTDAQFGDQFVGGQYQVPSEALSVVENEKSIDSLIGVRKNFQDRIQKSKGYR